ncbi:MAG: hypothetical protein IT431_13450 [Phycisphaerales bacterium]|nr:hypothetical protein [Phycisphaerales bacterium]
MAARDSDTKADAGKPGEGSKAKGGGGRGRPPPDAVARAMAEVERTLDRLKQMRTERAEAEASFKSELEARDAEIAALRADRDAGAARVAEVEGRLARLQAASEEARAVESERDAALAKLEEVGRRLGEFEASLGAERSARELAESRLAEAEGETRSRIEQLREQLAQAEERERGLGDSRDRERHEAEATIQELTDRLAAAEAAAGDQVAGLRRAVDSLEARASSAEGERSELQARLADADRRMGEAGQAANAEIQSLRARADAVEAEREEVRSQAASIRAEFEAKLGEAEHRLGQADADTDALIARVTELEAMLSARAGEMEGALRNASILDAKVAEQEAEIGRVRGELGAAQGALAERDARLAAGDASAQEELATLRAELERRGAEAAELRAAIGVAQSQSEAQAQGAQNELRAALDAERAQVRELTEKLDMAADRLVEMQTALDEQSQALERSGGSDGAVAELTRELDALRSRLADAERERDAAVVGGVGGPPSGRWDAARVAGRRERLRRCRALLREREQQAARVAQVLEQKSQKCDELLARRRELVEARQVIERTHKKVVSARAKSGAGATVFFGLAIITVLAGLSWAVVTRIFPATYAASAVVGADFQGVAVKPGEIEAWQAFHEQLARDPNLMSRVAERMAQRGFVDLGQPAVVKAMVDADMTVTSPKDGVLAFELRGLGQDTTARKLDTFVTTLAAEANALRQRRTDPSTTIVSERARAGVDPIEDPRLEYAGMGIGVGAAFAFLLWFGIWRRMVRSKHAFEHETEIEGLLEESRWVDPIQQIIEARVDGTGNRAA